ncbi:MAG: TraR/DksA family transcriptional regulator [Desulfobulbaceae bacterium]|nr:TraR/DksA family transcriptional regulator [Desulfobulbaceae bacterium]
MNDLDLENFKQLILLQHQELIEMKQRSQKSSQPVTLDQSSVGRLSRMDAMQSQAMALENKRRREIQLSRISAALERIEEGEYGYCASCEEEINRRRLEVDPANPFCVSCASKM